MDSGRLNKTLTLLSTSGASIGITQLPPAREDFLGHLSLLDCELAP
jgi:hypothetical protein